MGESVFWDHPMINSSLMVGAFLIVLHVLFVICLLRGFISTPLSPMFKHIFSAFSVLGLLCFLNKIFPQINFELVLSILLFGVACCFFAFGAVYKSLSLRFLLVTFAHNGRVSLITLNELVTNKTFFDRAQLLCQMGLVVKDNESYKLSEQGKRQLKWIKMFRKIFGIQTSGLYAQNDKQDDSSCSV